MQGWTIGQLARRAEVPLQTIRYYERRGLLPSPPRSPSGYRMYGPEALRRLQFIRQAQRLGFTLREIQELLDLRVEGEASCQEVRAVARRKLESVRERIRQLQALEEVLDRLARICPGEGPLSACPILDLLEKEALCL